MTHVIQKNKSTKTELIGVKEFRNNMSEYIRKAQKGNKRFILTSNNIPMVEIFTIKPDLGKFSAKFVASVLKGQKEIRQGKFYTEEEIFKMFKK